MGVKDEAGSTLYDALERFGCNPVALPSLARDPSTVLGFVEVHIEQGPVLEEARQPLGAVTAIAGIERHMLSFHGKAGHAGTTPMTTRQDALVGASEFILNVNKLCRATEDIVGTVGTILAKPNSINVIPETVHLGLELRSPYREKRLAARREISAIAERIARTRELSLEFELTYERNGIDCASHLIEALSSAIQRCGYEPVHLHSGAGHDGLAMGSLCDVGMLFVRCRNGLSHHPNEAATEEDVEAAVLVLLDFLTNFNSDDSICSKDRLRKAVHDAPSKFQ